MSILSFFRRKQTSPAPDPAAAMCVILSLRQERPDDDTLRNALRRAFGPTASCSRGNDKGWALKVPGAEMTFLEFVAAPVPNGKAE